MILKGWDGINFEILTNPKQLKALHDVTVLLRSEDLKVISQEFKKKGFDLTPEDVHALIREFQITTEGVAKGIHNGNECPHEVQPSESTDGVPECTETQKKVFIN